MSEGKKFVERTIVADPNRFKSVPASYPEEKLSAYQRRVRREQVAPYSKKSKPSSSKLSKDEELALAGLIEINNKEIADVKDILNTTPSKPVPEGMNPFTPSELDRSIMREEFKRLQPSALNFDGDFDFGLDLDEKLEEKGGRRRKSRKVKKLRKSSKKSRKSKRKTTRKMRRHR